MPPFPRASTTTGGGTAQSIYLHLRSQLPRPLTHTRLFSQESYGGNQKPQDDRPLPASRKSRELEHPGPPPPKTSEISQNTGAPVHTEDSEEAVQQRRQHHHHHHQQQYRQERQEKIPSNKARPTLNDGGDSPIVDTQGNVREDVPEDVKRHNRELQQRYDRAYNQIADGGKVSKGFWKGGEGV